MYNTARRVVQSKFTCFFIRLGYSIRGLLYGSIGFFAIIFSFDKIARPLSTTDIIQLIHTFIFGQYLLLFLIAGLFGYIIWGVMRAFMDILFKHKRKVPLFARIAYLISAISYTTLVVTALSIFLNLQINKDSKSLTYIAEKVIFLPYGKYILLIVSILSMVGGMYQILRAIKAKNPTDLWADDNDHSLETPFMLFAKIGITARGIIFILIGFFIALASLHTNPSDAKNISEIFLTLKNIPFGSMLLQAIGTGLIFFGLYSTILSFWVNLP
jgi:hypothetical protein